MKTVQTYLLTLCMAFVAFGCSDDKAAGPAGKTDIKKEALIKADPFLESVPAETPFFATVDTASLPSQTFKSLQDAVKNNQELAQQLEAGAKSDDPTERFSTLVMKAVIDNFTANTLAKIGLPDRPRVLVSGLGLWPTVSFQLADGAAFEQWLKSVEGTAKITAKVESFEGQSYRSYPIDELVSTVFSIEKNRAVFAVTPNEIKNQMLGYILGKKKVANRFVDSKRYQTLVKDYAKEHFNLAFIDTVEFFKTLASQGTGLNKTLVVAEMKNFNLDDVCVGEITAQLETMPLLIAASTQLTDTISEGLAMIEMSSARATDAMSVKSTRAGVEQVKSLFSIGLAIDSGKAIDLIKKAAGVMAKAPFKCTQLLPVNAQIAKLNGQLLFVPPFARAFRALDIYLTGWNAGGDGTIASASPSAMIILSAENAPMVFEAVKGLVPMLAAMPALKDDGQPVALNQFPLPPFLKAPHIALGKHAIGISIGEGEAEKLKGILSSGKTSPAPYFTLSYDMDGLAAILQTMAPSNAGASAALEEFKKLGMSGKSVSTIDATDKGIKFFTRAELKKTK